MSDMIPRFVITAFIIVALGLMSRAHADARFATVSMISTVDQVRQPAWYWSPKVSVDEPRPLLVVLHTWSGGYNQKGFGNECLKFCEQRGWAIIQPHFRGPNNRPQACGSDWAVQDVLDAVAFVKSDVKVDMDRIYLVGTSGGGHMAMLMAGRHPGVWAGVSAWVGISDLAAWHAETMKSGRTRYTRNIEAVVGAKPGTSDKVDEALRRRSPLTHLPDAKGVAIDLNAGIHDGHTGSVPISHTLNAFNVLAEANGLAARRLTDDQIKFMTSARRIPDALAEERVDEPGRKHDVLFRREAGPVRVTIFDGGHTGDMEAAMNWLAGQRRTRPPVQTQP